MLITLLPFALCKCDFNQNSYKKNGCVLKCITFVVFNYQCTHSPPIIT